MEYLINYAIYDPAKEFGMDVDYRYNAETNMYELVYVDYLGPGDWE